MPALTTATKGDSRRGPDGVQCPHTQSGRYDFAEVIESPWPAAPSPRLRNLGELLFDSARNPSQPVILGTLEDRRITITLERLRHAVVELADWARSQGLLSGQTVCVARMPGTSETLVAVTYAALTAAGLRVLLPMYADESVFRDWLRTASVEAVIWSAAETRRLADDDAVARLERWERVAAEERVRTYCIEADLGLPERLRAPVTPLTASSVDSIVQSASSRTESVIFTTSGTSGLSKLVAYEHGAILRCCAAWEQAGLFHPERHGGPGLCLLFSHSMGVRAFWNAVWSGQSLCLIPPEWFAAHPERVRALLTSMKPTHITGGPGVFRALLELARVFADLRQSGFGHLKCAVSIGAAFDRELYERFHYATGLELQNGFGMTEAMQVTTTHQNQRTSPEALGVPLPGVRLGLRASSAHPKGIYQLHISSPFGASRMVGGDPIPEFLATGDLVRHEGGEIVFEGRERDDFFNDCTGLKIPRRRLADFYGELDPVVQHVELFPLSEEPGLAAVVFVGDAAGASESGSLILGRLTKRVEASIDGRHQRLYERLSPTEFRHMTVSRFACVAGQPPRTAKGTARRSSLREQLGPVVARLTGPIVKAPGIRHLDRSKYLLPAFVRLTSPHRGHLLHLAKLDKSFVGGRGDRLTYIERGERRSVDDFVGGFGTNLLGHRHPDVVVAAAEFVAGEGVFLSDQGSARNPQADLAARLSRFVGEQTGGGYVVRFGSTGTEAVEMALAHALLEQEKRLDRLERHLKEHFGATHPELVDRCIAQNRRLWERRRPVVLGIRGGYHGNSLAARCVGGNADRRRPFVGALDIDTVMLPADGEVDLDAILTEHRVTLAGLTRQDDRVVPSPIEISNIFAAVVEPVLGEGGVVEVATDLLERLTGHSFPLISDEIQCGLGRTGAAVASMPVRADYYLFAKALGGGIAKISALLVEASRYVGRFDELYSSTFAGDSFSSTVAEAVLDVIERDDIPARAAERGAVIRAQLEQLREAFPTVVKAVRGRGLILAVELDANGTSRSILSRTLAAHDRLGVVVAAFLLDEHAVRVLPTLSAPNVLRIEPSAYIDDDAVARLVDGLRDVCESLRASNTAHLLSFLVRDDLRTTPLDAVTPNVTRMSTDLEAAAPDAIRVGFINHFVNPEDELVALEPSLTSMPRAVRRTLFHRLAQTMELKPLVVFRRNLFGGSVNFTSIAVTADAAMLEYWHRRGDRGFIRKQIQAAVDLAGQLGCEIVTLGGYTSIVTENGMSVTPPAGVRLATGNTLTVAIGARRILQACDHLNIDPQDPSRMLAIVGATGNIGRALTHRLLTGPRGAGRFRRAVLIGRDVSRLEALQNDVLATARSGSVDIEVSTDLSKLRNAGVIAVATNANAPLVYPAHLESQRATLVADLSVPSAVSTEAQALPMVHVIPLSGTVAVPGESDFVVAPHIEPGTAFCCAAESMLLGLEPEETAELELRGSIDPLAVRTLERIADRRLFLESLSEGACKPTGNR